MKEGIIVVNHGTMNGQVHTRCIEELVLSIKDRLEEAEVIHVYTDGNIRKKLREETGVKVQNLKAAILGLKEKGVTHLTVLTTDVFEGQDYYQMKEETIGLAGLFSVTNIARPLLGDAEDYEITARAVKASFGQLVGNDILLLLSGTSKSSDDDSMDLKIKEFERDLRKHLPNSYVASLHGDRKPYKVIKEIKQQRQSDNMNTDNNSNRIILVPFEYIAGQGIENKVSEEYPGLVSRLKEEGFTVEGMYKGISEYEDFLRLYMRHLYAARR
ncbi:MAG: sirohydrochlorin cobaltochelatase [Eubacterium sp.]|nr:sirohydrochlorin cobaltochelatase [Eubacterium sp.]